MRVERTTCCVVGGGPAGMMAGLLLARSGVDVTVLEKHEDFFRDFRGDTIHPATLRILAELGIAEEFLDLPHTRMPRVSMETASGPLTIAEFSRLRPYGFIAFLPQWDFLDFLYDRARAHPTFRLIRQAEVTELVLDGGRIAGVRAETVEGPLEVRADLVLAADGRDSVVRERAGLAVIPKSPPIDVLWFRLSRAADEEVPFFRSEGDGVLVSINRGTYWQLAYVIPHQGFDRVQERGLPTFRSAIAALVPTFADRLEGVTTWEQVKLLSVRVDRLRTWWRPGLLCIGDAAHAMSPAGGVGINLAIQDAVAAANVLAPALRAGGVTTGALRAVQRRRELPTRITQAFQIRVVGNLYPRSGGTDADRPDPLPIRLIRRLPALRHLTGRFIGMGVRPEHVHTAVGTPVG
ncbi:2-polyprenyl-6-methoxyphenol hydroxylase [Geodermatophilus pulveris]|uniref:2-polyprenyl-6-methoxyphenol hydroxylase n=2 Tax=Geodermatophilus pulveris TaxID=1564159 RepID=A0A239C2P5_9ACTN|nr:2-polyprenyl-6-methoxyphenol hydroxylase [Geodermatophilus pulveris]